jgi:MFS family permease
LWGRLSDAVGRRPVLLLGLIGSTTFYALFGLASQWRSLAWMYVARIGAGVACATISTAAAYIADVTPPERRARGMALIGVAFGLGFTFGPLLGAAALALSPDAPTSPMPGFAAAALSAVALLIAIFRLPESRNPAAAAGPRRGLDLASLRTALRVPSIGLLLLCSFLGVFAMANIESTITLAIDSLVSGAAAQTVHQATTVNHAHGKVLMVFTVIGLVQGIVQGVIVRRLALYCREVVLAAIGGTLAVLGFILMAVVCGTGAGGIAGVMLAGAVTVSGIGFLAPSMQSLISRRSDPAKQGGILGLGDSVSTLARICGMSCGITLFLMRPALPYWTAAVLMSVTTVLVLSAAGRGRDYGAAGVDAAA